MDRKSLESLVVENDRLGDTKIIGLRLPVALVKKLKAKNIDIQSTVRNLLERLAE